MSKPINLNRVRKDKARAEKRARADANAAKFGRTKAQKDLEKSRQINILHEVDQHRREE
jgi:hypothetical protein